MNLFIQVGRKSTAPPFTIVDGCVCRGVGIVLCLAAYQLKVYVMYHTVTEYKYEYNAYLTLLNIFQSI